MILSCFMAAVEESSLKQSADEAPLTRTGSQQTGEGPKGSVTGEEGSCETPPKDRQRVTGPH